MTSKKMMMALAVGLGVFTGGVKAQSGWTDSNGTTWDGGSVEDNINDGGLAQDGEGDGGGAAANGELDCAFRGDGAQLIEGVLSFKHIVNQVANTLEVEVTFQGEGWVAFGVSPDGNMPGSEVVIGLPDEAQGASNPGKYAISARSQAAVVLSGQQTLTEASVEQDSGVTILRFTKALAEANELEINADAPNTFVYAVGSSNTFGYHAQRGSATIQSLSKCLEAGQDADPDEDQAPVVTGSNEPPNKSLWVAHGILMFISWGILLPIGIGCSLVRRLVPGNGTWFKLHRFCNGTAFLLMTAAFGIAVSNVQNAGTAHFSENRHRTIGLVIYILSFLQVVGGIFRPHLPHAPPPKEVEADVEADVDAGKITNPEQEVPKKSIQRVVFEVGHRVFGFGLLGLSWYNLYLGILAIVAFYGPSYDLSAAMWGVIGGISGLIFVLFVYTKAVPVKKD